MARFQLIFRRPDEEKLLQRLSISNLSTHCRNNKHHFPDIQNVKLIKITLYGHKMNIFENLNMYSDDNNYSPNVVFNKNTLAAVIYCLII